MLVKVQVGNMHLPLQAVLRTARRALAATGRATLARATSRLCTQAAKVPARPASAWNWAAGLKSPGRARARTGPRSGPRASGAARTHHSSPPPAPTPSSAANSAHSVTAHAAVPRRTQRPPSASPDAPCTRALGALSTDTASPWAVSHSRAQAGALSCPGFQAQYPQRYSGLFWQK